MYEQVVVKEVVSDLMVRVGCSQGACTGCKSSSMCNIKGREFNALNEDHLPLAKGMVVTLFLPPKRTVACTLITLLAPLIFFPAGYFLFSRFGEAGSALAGFCGVALGFVLVGLYFRYNSHRYIPTVASIIG